jgi:two-component system, OmpR family, sensor kinase
MSAPGGSAGLWQSVRTLPARTPLRVKLITAVLALVAIALVLISVAGLGYLRSNLLGQADSLLASERGGAIGAVHDYLVFHSPGTSFQQTLLWLPDNSRFPQEVIFPVGKPFYGGVGTAPTHQPGPEIVPGASWLTGKIGPVTVAATAGGARWRVIAFPHQTFGGPGNQVTGTIIVGEDVTGIYRTIGKLTGIDLIVSSILLIGLAVIGVAVVRASLRPLTDIEKTAEAIAAGDLSRRVPDRDPRTEIGRLGRSLNAMLAQIERAFNAQARSEAAARRSEDRMRQFVADASHELRTPLTAIRGFAEYYRQRGGVLNGNGAGELTPADLDRIMQRLEQESSRMGILIEDMLLLARLDQQRPLERGPVDLLTLAADAVHDARVVAPGRDIALTVGSGAALLVLGDEVRLRQVIGNLMSNALAHTPDGTPIDVRIRSGSLAEAQSPTTRPAPPPPGRHNGMAARSAAVLEVTDHGPGLTREQSDHAFERFYRADQSRTAGGTGLGLAIVAALVAAHGGAVWVESAPGAGATFRIALPLAPEAQHEDQDDELEDDHVAHVDRDEAGPAV